jgi:hypothetical protein
MCYFLLVAIFKDGVQMFRCERRSFAKTFYRCASWLRDVGDFDFRLISSSVGNRPNIVPLL